MSEISSSLHTFSKQLGTLLSIRGHLDLSVFRNGEIKAAVKKKKKKSIGPCLLRCFYWRGLLAKTKISGAGVREIVTLSHLSRSLTHTRGREHANTHTRTCRLLQSLHSRVGCMALPQGRGGGLPTTGYCISNACGRTPPSLCAEAFCTSQRRQSHFFFFLFIPFLFFFFIPCSSLRPVWSLPPPSPFF